MIKCPKDGTNLENQRYESTIYVDLCPTCKGIWLDNGELEKIQETIENDHKDELKKISNYIGNSFNAAIQKSRPLINCPICNIEMTRREYGYCSQIILDICPNCNGIWLDNNELQALEVFFEKSRIETNSIKKSFWRSLKDFLK